MPAITHSDYILQKATAASTLVVVPGVWVRLLNNSTATNYYSTAVTDAQGAFTHSAVPGDYSLYYGTAATVIGTPNLVNAHYPVPVTAGDDVAAGSYSALASSPYTPILPTGSSAIYGHKFSFAPAGGVTDDGPNLQTLVNAAPANSTIEFQPGTFLINTSVTPKSNQTFTAARGSVTLKRTVVGDIFVSTNQALDNCTISGLTFDMTNVGWSAIDFIGSDANGQITNLTIRDCKFINPSTTWMIQVQYTIVDPAIPTLKNRNIRMEDCWDDATGGAFSLENIIFINCQDVVVSGCRFLNTPASLAAHIAIYGYCRNVRFIGNYVENWLSLYGVYVVQSDAVSLLGDQFRTTAAQTCVQIYNSKDVKVIGCQMITSSTGQGVSINDFGGTTFDGHTNLYVQSSGIAIQENRMDVMTTCVLLNLQGVQGQTDIRISDNLVSPFRSLFLIQNMPASPSATVKRISITDNHVASHSGFSGGASCIVLGGNASAANGGLQSVTVTGNTFAASGGGGSGCDVEVTTLADDIAIFANHHLGSATPIVIAATATKVRTWGNVGADGGIGGLRIVSATAPLTGQTAAVASVTTVTAPNDGPGHTYRVSGSVRITTLGSGSINLQVTYTDDSGAAQTCSIPLCAQAGAFVAAAVTATDYTGSVTLRVNPNTAVTIKTAGTFTGCTYNVWGSIEQLA